MKMNRWSWVFLLALLACSSSPQREGTRRMAARLAQIAKEQNPAANYFLNGARVEYYRSQKPPADPIKKIEFDVTLAKELLYAGQTEEAIDLFRQVQPQAERYHLKAKPSIEDLLALAYLRLGEQDNCILQHNSHSCVFPIAGDGIHQNQRGSRQAIEAYTALLQSDPTDLASRWLLNIAYMTVGEYPQRVPPQWLIPLSTFASDYDIKPFPDIAPSLGLDLKGLSGAVISEDFDNDGFLDLLISRWGLQDQLRYFHSEGNGHFTERTEEAGLTGIVSGLNMMQTDYNNDGNADVLVLRGAWFGEEGRIPHSLLRNNGDDTFEDVTEAAGMFSANPTQTAAWGDYDNDGWVDVFIGNETMPGSPHERFHPCELFHNERQGTFTEVAKENGLAVVGFVKGAVWADYDNDGDLDLYLSRFTEPNLLFKNEGSDGQGHWGFAEVGRQAGVSQPLRSFPTWFFDYDNDGWEDLFVAGYETVLGRAIVQDVVADYLGLPTEAERCRLYHNRGDGTFEDVSQQARVSKVIYTMGCNFGDLDNDGWLDFYLGTGNPDYRSLTPHRMFRNAGGQFFQDVTTSGGFGNLQKGHGVSFADLDNDGDQDVYEVIGGAYTGDVYQNMLFENPGHGKHWITLKLEGVQSNRAGIGARIRVRVSTPAGSRDIRATVGTGASFGANSLQQELGLGDATGIEEIEVRWPSGEVQRFTGVAMDHFYQLREDREDLILQERRQFSLAGGGAPAHHH
ncbi:MAG: CRTAC1 family protein [Candidatus Latescibacteria bacterium]|nr:CRTAC1 family protein [Candidatus Latescibacterota bacterium]